MPRRAVPYLFFGLFLAMHIGLEWSWQSMDNHLPDGDESGHLGAIELYRDIIRDRGLGVGIREAFRSSSEYPPLFALAYAVPLAYLGPDAPFPAGVDALLIFWSVLTLLATAGLTRTMALRDAHSDLQQVEDRDVLLTKAAFAGIFAAFVLATSPLAAGLVRHIMPETLLGLWIVLVLWAGLAGEGMSRPLYALLLGLACTAAFLTKQTAVLYLFGPLVFFAWQAWRNRPHSFLGTGVALLVALPLPLWWMSMHWAAQRAYAQRSIEAKAVVSWAESFFYHPFALTGLGLGLFWSLFLGGAIVVLLRSARSLPLFFSAVNVLLLGFVPKKYPRLDFPILPLAALIIGLGIFYLESRRLRRALLVLGVTIGLAQHVVLSFSDGVQTSSLGLWRPAYFERVDPDCPQSWIRPASREALGFDRILTFLNKGRHLSGGGRRVVFVGIPLLPCDYETTFGWDYHLLEYLRRHGLEFEQHSNFSAFSEVSAGDRALFEETDAVVAGVPWCVLEGGKGQVVKAASPSGSFPLEEEREGVLLFERFCDLRAAFGDGVQVEVRAGTFRFAVYVYQRKPDDGADGKGEGKASGRIAL